MRTVSRVRFPVMTFKVSSLLSRLPDPGAAGRIWVGYSGGLDSTVLLHAMHELAGSAPALAGKLCALHVNHGLSPAADRWQAHCEAVCRTLGVSLTVRRARVDDRPGVSPEEAARDARYQVFGETIAAGEYLLLAHQRDDQLETMLQRLMRGSGARGLAAIPRRRDIGGGLLIRPLLEWGRDELLAWARQRELAWIEDASNTDTRFDRNFLRHRVLPLLRERWPGFEENWRRSGELLAEADALQAALGREDLARVRSTRDNRLDVTALAGFDAVRQRNLLRGWFDELARQYDLPVPGYHALRRIVDEVLPAADDAAPLVRWGDATRGAEVRRFAGELYALRRPARAAPEAVLDWSLDAALELPARGGRLSLLEAGSDGLALDGIDTLQVRFRRGGESARPAGRKTRPLKKIFQDYGVPPWLRERVPLIYRGDELVAVGDLFVCEAGLARPGEKQYRIRWQREDL